MEKKISIIMGIYNCEDSLPEAIDSIINQTYKNWELIMCDDCSKDRTYEIASEYRRKYPNKIKVLKNNKNLKLAATLNRCLEHVTGDYIARMDADDRSHELRFENQVKFLNENPDYNLVGSNLIIFDSKGVKGVRKVKKIPGIKEIYYGSSPFAHPATMCRREVYEALNGYTVAKRTQNGQDIDLWIRFFSKKFKGYNLQDCLYYYQENQNQNFKASIGVTKTLILGVKILNLPFYYYFISFKPILSGIVPRRVINFYHNCKIRREKKY